MKTPLVLLSLLPYAKHSTFKAHLVRLCLFLTIYLGISQTAIAVPPIDHPSFNAYLTNLGTPIVAQQPYPEQLSLAAFFETKSPRANHMGHPFLVGRRFLGFHLQQRPLLGCKYISLANAGHRTILSSLFGRASVWALSIITTN